MRRVSWNVWKAGLMAAVIGLTGLATPAQASATRAAQAGAAQPAQAAAARPAQAGDVNGDGRADVIAGLPLLAAEGKGEAGGVTVYFGGPAKVSATGRTVTLARPAVKENLGRTLATGDFDRDGYADVLASARGRLVVLPGSKAGLRGDRATMIPWPVTAPAMAAADFDGDGYGDVAVTGSKQVVVLRGGAQGLRVSGRLTDGAPQFGAELAAGDVNGDRLPDLVTTEHRVAYPDPLGPQRITVVPGSRTGLSLSRAWSIAPAERAARDLAVGDVNGDRLADLVRITSAAGNAFGVVVQLSRGTGFGPAQTLTYGQDYPADLGLGDVTGDSRADLAVHLSNGGHDWAVLHPGTATGLTAQPARRYGGDGYETGYGTSLRLANVSGDQRADLIAGLPGVYGTGELEILPEGSDQARQRLTATTASGLGRSQPS